jgi:hypothetical protein
MDILVKFRWIERARITSKEEFSLIIFNEIKEG